MIALIDNLTRAGRPPIILYDAEGGRMLVLPESGRILGLYARESQENFLWTNPALGNAESAAEFFGRDGWLNPGGDRTWLAPEIELFIGDLARPGETYAVPATLDSGQWRREDGAYGLRLRNQSAVHLKHSDRTIHFTVAKDVRPAANPLRSMKLGLSYAGYEQTTTLELAVDRNGNVPPAQLGVWNLLQLPKPGRMIVPTYRRAVPQTVFGDVPSADLELADHAFIWSMADTGKNAKISVKADVLTGRAGYLCRSQADGDLWSLVVRNFTVNPSGNYVDALWNNPADTGYAFQACAVNEGTETFNELEYHAPAAETADGRNRACDRSQVWAFRGGADKISEAIHVLLGIDDINHRVLRNSQARCQVSGKSFALNPEPLNTEH
jgi:hypothetical protein